MTTQCPKCNSENTETARFCSNCATPLQPSEEVPVPTQTIEVPREELTTGSTFADRYHWKDADPGIAKLEDARERLAGLKG